MATINNTPTLDSWLADTIGNPARRAAVRALVDSLRVDGPRTLIAVDIEKGPSKTTYMSRAGTRAGGAEYWPMRFALRQGGVMRVLAGESLKYGWMDSSYEDRLRTLRADEIFQVRSPEDGEYGCMFRKGPEHEKTDRYGKKFLWA